MGKLKTFLLAGAAGAAAAYLFDPDLGRSRRARLRDQLSGKVREGTRRAERLARYAESEAEGAYQRLKHRQPADPEPEDQTLAHKVESEVLGHVDVPAGKVNVNAEHGVVILRGEVGDEGLIREIEDRTLSIPGVEGVENLLHLPGQPAPNKEEARRAAG